VGLLFGIAAEKGADLIALCQTFFAKRFLLNASR
jgi:hypothetical protein